MNLKILSYNINGIRSFKNWEFILKSDFDIIALQEIRYDNIEELKKYELKNYYCFWGIDTIIKGHGGTLLMTKYKPLEIIKDEIEGRYILLKYIDIYIMTIYIPHAGEQLQNLNKKLLFLKNLNKFIKKINKPLLLFGDMNVALYDHDVKSFKLKYNKPGFT